MRKTHDGYQLSATDLSIFLSCNHAIRLEKELKDGKRSEAEIIHQCRTSEQMRMANGLRSFKEMLIRICSKDFVLKQRRFLIRFLFLRFIPWQIRLHSRCCSEVIASFVLGDSCMALDPHKSYFM